MSSRLRCSFLVPMCGMLLAALGLATGPPEKAENEAEPKYGQPVLEQHEFGDAWLYRPLETREGAAAAVLILVHGTPGEDETATDVSRTYIDRWTAFADEHRLILIAPAFDEARYRRAYGGYRGLFGRDIGADEFVERLVQIERTKTEVQDPSLLFYGHSAGGQFVCRFLLQHPNRVRAAILSAPGRYTFPDPDTSWPYGMGRFDRTLEWGGDGPNAQKREIVEPKLDTFVQAACRPVMIVVGARDLEPQPKRPAHHGRTRIELAKQWVCEMNALAKAHGKQPGTRGMVVPDIGHNSQQLTLHCQNALLRLVSE